MYLSADSELNKTIQDAGFSSLKPVSIRSNVEKSMQRRRFIRVGIRMPNEGSLEKPSFWVQMPRDGKLRDLCNEVARETNSHVGYFRLVIDKKFLGHPDELDQSLKTISNRLDKPLDGRCLLARPSFFARRKTKSQRPSARVRDLQPGAVAQPSVLGRIPLHPRLT